MSDAPIAVFCDFDGTVSRRDVGYHLFRHFSGGENEKLLPDWKSGRLSTRDCLVREAAMVRASREEIYRFIEQFELDSGFQSFVDRCRANGTDLTVVSDGLDFYIKHIFERDGLKHLPVIANRGVIANGGLQVEFVHHNRSCERCGSCKGERIREYRQRRGSAVGVVFVGDGYSDACAVTEADIVFAKKDLEQYCRVHNIGYYEYDDFFDVAQKLVDLGYLTA
ncbi:MAG: MtnX-like HAD-IB family phosphatase [Candidatus Zixiibacteriota bacterium]|nr:MAG: MtnX-like HAD-IB family phosphatase [candidate division Zixibacteria bacterium]